jgi:hypothetical protein
MHDISPCPQTDLFFSLRSKEIHHTQRRELSFQDFSFTECGSLTSKISTYFSLMSTRTLKHDAIYYQCTFVRKRLASILIECIIFYHQLRNGKKCIWMQKKQIQGFVREVYRDMKKYIFLWIQFTLPYTFTPQSSGEIYILLVTLSPSCGNAVYDITQSRM